MITAEIKINGTMLGHLYIVRDKPIVKHTLPVSYTFEYYEISKGVSGGSVMHKPVDGALRLLRTVIDKIHPYTREVKDSEKGDRYHAKD